MSVKMNKANGVTTFTVTSDPDSHWPPLCQILRSLCYSPVCCSVSQQLRSLQKGSLLVLGSLQILVGLVTVGLGVILTVTTQSGWYIWYGQAFPLWMGGLFVLFGAVNILSEKYPSPCMLILNVTLNLAGVAFAIASVVLFSVFVRNAFHWSRCNNWDYWPHTTPRPSDQSRLREDCLEAEALVVLLQRCIAATLIVLSALELCLVFSSVVLSIKALRSSTKKNMTSEDPEQSQPLLEEANINTNS